MALQPRGNHAPDGLTRGLVAPVHAVHAGHAGELLDDAVRSRTSEKLVRKRGSNPRPRHYERQVPHVEDVLWSALPFGRVRCSSILCRGPKMHSSEPVGTTLQPHELRKLQPCGNRDNFAIRQQLYLPKSNRGVRVTGFTKARPINRARSYQRCARGKSTPPRPSESSDPSSHR